MNDQLFTFLEAHLGSIFTFVGGFIIAYMTKYLPSSKKQNSDDFKLLIETYQTQYKNIVEEVKAYKQKEQECLDRYSQLEEQLLRLQSNMTLMRASSPNIPIPMWVKDTNGTMLALNDEYERAFLMPKGKRREDYIGRKDDDLWGAELAKQFRSDDRLAIAQDEPIVILEPIQIGEDEDLRFYNIIKYPNKIGDLVVTVGGIAFPVPRKKYTRKKN